MVRLLFKFFRNIGEAANPGPEGALNNIRIWSANVTSLAKRWEVMCKWGANIIATQEVRLGEEAQRIMAARITQDLRVPVFGRPMPLKEGRCGANGVRTRPTIWDAQQGGLAFIVDPAIPAQRVEVGDDAYHLVEERRMEHLYVPCYKGDRGFHVESLRGSLRGNGVCAHCG